MSDTPPLIRRREALAAFLLAVVFSITLKAGLDQIVWKFAGPITLIVTLGLATLYLHRRGESWRALGLRRPGGWKSFLLVAPQTLLGIVAILNVFSVVIAFVVLSVILVFFNLGGWDIP